VSLRRREVELCVERALGPERSGGTVRLGARFDVGEGGEGPSPADLARELDRLTEELAALLGPPIAAAPLGRVERDLTELVETYRPRQRDLVDLLLADGELTAAEHGRLVEYLGSGAEARTPPGGPRAIAETDRLIASVPIDRPPAAPERLAAPGGAVKSLESARPVAELLKTYQIASLRQAGAVRGRREISFAEYMALKRHFEEEEARAAARASKAPG
jgi:hypothetical protein